MLGTVISIKLLINAGVAITFYFKGRPDMALMFAGFAVADAGSLWVATR